MGVSQGSLICALQLLDVPHLDSYERHCVLCLQEFNKHDEQPNKYLKSYTGHNPKTGQEFTCDVAYERFLGPELFFNPEIYSSDYTTPLPQVLVKFPSACSLKDDHIDCESAPCSAKYPAIHIRGGGCPCCHLRSEL